MFKYFYLAIFTGVFLAFPWIFSYGVFFSFFAFVPLMLMEHEIANFSNTKRKKITIFLFSFLCFFIWNILTTGWLFNSRSPDGSRSVVAVTVPTMLNSSMMSFVFLFYHIYKKKIGTYWGFLFFIVFWICFEKFHFTWELSWPWLTLGNAFAFQHKWIQWYDISGVFGGSLWILFANIFAYYTYRTFQVTRKRKILVKNILIFSLIIVIPIIFSLIKYNSFELHSENTIDAVLLQPDVDPYTEKYNTSGQKIVTELLDLAEEKSSKNVDFFIAPETAIPGYGEINEDTFTENQVLNDIVNFTRKHYKSIFLTGASTYRIYYDEQEKSETAYFLSSNNIWIDNYNTALQIIPNEDVQVYHKGRLVPGVESFPYIRVLKPLLGNLMLDFGGSIASLGRDKERKIFLNSFNNAKIAPVICYESIYGEYVTEYVKNGANIFAIITNDSWWGNSLGHKHLLAQAKLRAIETRREILRSANSGISAHINALGDITESLPYGYRGALHVTAHTLKGETKYVKYGDVIYRICLFIFGFLSVYLLYKEYLSIKSKLKVGK